MAYSQYMAEGQLGSCVSETAERNIVSRTCKTQVYVGRGICKVIGKDDQIRNFANNTVKLVFVGDLITDNVVNLKVNGSAIAPVTFSSSHAATMALIVLAIAAKTTYVASATLSAAREITVNGIDNTVIALTEIVVSAGVSQTTASQTNGTRDKLAGLVFKTQVIESSLPNVTEEPSYPATGVANIYKGGGCGMYVWFETAFNPDTDTLYVRYIDGGTGKAVGQFRNDADSNTAIAVTGNFEVRKALSGVGIGVIELNKPV